MPRLRHAAMPGLFGLALTGLALAAASATADVVPLGKEGELGHLLKPGRGARICFSRVYDKAHLAEHPKQKVTRMDFRLAYYIHDPDDYYADGQRNYYFQMRVKLRDRARTLKANGECSPTSDGKGIFCGVECDGGGVMVKERPGDKLFVDLESMGRIRMSESCDDDEENSIDVESGADDRNFLLSRTSPSDCPVYDSW